MRKFANLFFSFIIASIISAALFIICLSFFLYKTPREFNSLNKIIEYKLAQITNNSDIKLSKSTIELIKGYKLNLSINDLNIKKNEDHFKAKNLNLTIDFSRLIKFLNIIENIEINEPILSLKTKHKGNFNSEINTNFINKLNLSKFFNSSFILKKGILIIDNQDSRSQLEIDNLFLQLSNLFFKLDFAAQIDNKKLSFTVNTKEDLKNNFISEIKFTNMSIPAILEILGQSQHPVISILNRNNNVFYINGMGNINFNNKGIIKDVNLILDSKEGFHITENKNLLNLDKLKAQLIIKNNLQDIFIKNFHINYVDNISANLDAHIKLRKEFYKNKVEEIKLDCEVNNIPINFLSSLWPKQFNNKAREWVTKRIKNGFLTHGKGKIFFDKEFFSKNTLKPNNLDASINIENADLKYLDNFSPIEKINGKIKFDHKKLTASLKTAVLKDTSLKNISLHLPYEMEQINIVGQSVGPIDNNIEFIPSHIKDKIEKYAFKIKNNKQIAQSEIDITFPLIPNHDYKILINSTIPEITLDALEEQKINNISLKLATNKHEFTSEAIFNYKNLPCKFNYNFNENNNLNYFLITSELDQKFKEQFNWLNFISLAEDNKIPITINFDNNDPKMIVNLDLSNSTIKYDYLSLYKKQNDKLLLEFTINDKIANTIKVDNIYIFGDSIEGNGNLVLNYADKSVKNLYYNFSKMQNNQNLILEYNDTRNKELTIKADKLDLSKINFAQKEKIVDKDNIKDSIYNIKANYVLLDNDQIFNNFDLSLEFSPDYYFKKFNAKANLPNNSYAYAKLHDQLEQQVIIIKTNNGGSFLKAFNLYNNANSGNLIANIFKTKNKQNHLQFEGQTDYQNFYLTNQSFVTKILVGLTSFSGIKNFVSNKIKISTFHSNFNFDNNILKLDGTIINPSFKIEMVGEINRNNDKIAIKGSLLPSVYGINTTIKNIPILGKVISGNQEGAIVANYEITGAINNHKLYIDPLSLLPLGFFRNLFSE